MDRVNNDIAITVATITKVPKEDEQLSGRIAKTLTSYSDMNVKKIIVADGGSYEPYKERWKNIKGVEIISVPGPTLAKQICYAIISAGSIGYPVLYTEPDKDRFARGYLNGLFNLANRTTSTTSMVLASRKIVNGIWPGYTPEQFIIEQAVNSLISGTLYRYGTTNDFLYGPKLIMPDVVGELKRFNFSKFSGWEPLMYAVAKAAKIGDLQFLLDEMPAPEEKNKSCEEIIKERLRHAKQNIDGFFYGWNS